jgi:hypothetical protein
MAGLWGRGKTRQEKQTTPERATVHWLCTQKVEVPARVQEKHRKPVIGELLFSSHPSGPLLQPLFPQLRVALRVEEGHEFTGFIVCGRQTPQPSLDGFGGTGI